MKHLVKRATIRGNLSALLLSLALIFFTPLAISLENTLASVKTYGGSDHFLPGARPLEGKFYKVPWVIDGDTIAVRIDRRVVKVRLLGVDTAEIVDSDKLTDSARRSKKSVKDIKKLGMLAKGFTEKMVKGKWVRLEYDLRAGYFDQYNRILAYVFSKEGTFLNAELIKRGYGRMYRGFSFKYSAEFQRLELMARAKKLGIWKNRDFPTTAPHR